MKTTKYLSRISASAALACLSVAAVLALLPSSVKAQCAMGWDVSGHWSIKQGPTTVTMNVSQHGNRITGGASYPWFDGRLLYGRLNGTISGDNFHVNIMWGNETVGVYDGTIGPKGQLTGTTHDRSAPSKKVSWISDTDLQTAEVLACAFLAKQ